MKRMLTLLSLLLLCATSTQAQVNLYVGDCGAGTTTHSVTNACLTNSGTAFTAFGSILVPSTPRIGFIGAMSVVDVQSSQAALPAWWDGAVCRAAGFALASDATMGGNCPTLWDAAPPAGNNITAQPGIGGPNRVRFLLGVVLDIGSAYDLVGDDVTETSVFKWSVLKSRSVGTGACAGCSCGATIVLTEVNLQTLTDTPATFVRLTYPITNNTITYNGGSMVGCGASTPTQNRTWGSIKSLYR